MNGFFKGVDISLKADEQSGAERVKEPPAVIPQNEPANAPRFGVPSAPETNREPPESEQNGAEPDTHETVYLPSVRSEKSGNTEYVPPYSGKGGIVVQVYLARQALPLENVKVTIKSLENAPNGVSEVRYTDQSGKTEKIFLPAPDMHFSMQAQDEVRPYAVYGVTAELDGYYVEPEFGSDGVIAALVFDNVCSIQNVEMIPDREK